MSWQRVPEGLGDEDHNFLKVYKINVTESRRVLLFLFTKTCPKHSTQSLNEYLLLSKGMTWNDFTYFFNSRQRIQMEADPSGKEFDISLLYPAIKYSCIGVTPELMNLVTQLKDYRNEFLHQNTNINIVVEVKKLQDLVEKTYLAIGTQFATDVSHEINLMKDNIDKVINAPLAVPDIIQYRQDLKTLRDGLKLDFRVGGQEELKNKTDNFTMTDPVSFISERLQTMPLKVTLIYTHIDLVEEMKGKKEDVSVQYENILDLKGKNGKFPDVLILEGPSGSGKTTLTKLMHAEWIKCTCGQPSSFINLNEFDLVLPYECSNTTLSSYKDLITNLLPVTTLYLRNEDILRSARELKILILVDAADDLNPKSKALLRELTETRVPESSGNLRILCTTRPQALKDLLSLIPRNKLTIVHTKISGIPHERRKAFVIRLHDVMISEGHSTQETNGLVNYLSYSQGRMGDHFRFPLMLTILTYLWAADPHSVNGVTTIASLYLAIHRLIKKRLFDRLSKHKKVKDVKNYCEIESSCCEFLKTLYRESLVSISLDAMILPDRCSQNLEKAAKQQRLPQAEVFAAFLSVNRNWTAYGYTDQLAGPHKSLLEFYGAYYIVEVITEKIKTAHQLDLENQLGMVGLNESEKIRITSELTESKTVYGVLNSIHKDIVKPLVKNKFQNLLIHLIGLLTHAGEEVLHQFHVEVIELMKESGLRGSTWFQVVSETKCDRYVAKTVAENMTDVDKESWSINDSMNISAAICILDTVCPKKLEFKLETDPTQSNINTLCNIMKNLDIEITLRDQHSWRNCESKGTYLPILNIPSSRCKVVTLKTTVTSITEIPRSVKKLYLGIFNDPVSKDPGLSNISVQCPELVQLGIHVMPGAAAGGGGVFSRIPDGPIVYLYLSQLNTDEDVDFAIKTTKELQPTRGYLRLSLPSCGLSAAQVMTLVTGWGSEGVTVQLGVWVSSPRRGPVTSEDQVKLQEALHNTVGRHCRLYWFTRDDLLPWW
ncbi:unnamed protein product, partial [Meganyctiphanes norvegica]